MIKSSQYDFVFNLEYPLHLYDMITKNLSGFSSHKKNLMQQPFMAYENDTSTLTIADLNVTNGMDKIIISGTLELTKDRQGFEHALKIKG